MRTSAFVLAVGLALVAFFAAACVATTYLESSDPRPVPVGWRRTTSGPLVRTQRRLNVIFAIKQRNLDVLEETFWAVSDPSNARYGQHLSLDQIAALVGPTEESVSRVTRWLRESGASDISVTRAREFVHASLTAQQATQMFGVEFHNYRHETGLTFDATVGPYSVPDNVAEVVDLVTGIVGFPEPAKPRVRHSDLALKGGNMDITPEVIRARYNVTSGLVVKNPKSSHAVAEFQAQYFDPSDLQTFWKDYVSFAPFRPIDQMIGFNSPDQPSLEGSLDIQYIMGVAPNATTWFYSMKQFDFWSDLVNWTSVIANEPTPPWIHSVSYGEQGNYPSAAYRERLNQEFQKLGARGLSIVFASGDDGAGCGGEEDASCCILDPSFPATCPYVTAIGATRFLSGNTGPEGAVQLFGSGGGFSWLFPVQTWQESAVHAYLSSGVKLPPACAYNASGRGTPDASALGDEYFQVIQDGSVVAVGGTSASAPTFSGIMTLLNDIRFSKGEAALGFLNPWIYMTAQNHPTAFFDVTNGNNINPGCCPKSEQSGFLCAAGWDPATGVGTPNFAVLSTIV
jgi:tripeptidyl-peptidase-1